MRLSPSEFHALVVGALISRGVPPADAAAVAECLLDAELEGLPSHGILRLPFLLRRLDAGLINPTPRLDLGSSRPAAAVLDADNGLGPVAGVAAVQAAAEMARRTGTATVAVRRSNHLGSMGFYVKRGAEAGLVMLAFSNTPPAMAPPGGRRAILGTNPIACGIPASPHPVVIDMATSQIARGRILKAAAANAGIPAGWAFDAEGRTTTDARAALGGSLAPVGGAKGFALALLVEVLAGVLSGAGVGPDVTGTFQPSSRPSDVGHCFMALDPGAFAPGFTERMDDLARAIRAVPPADGDQPVRVPGDRRQLTRAARAEAGIEVGEEVLAELRQLTTSHG